MGVKMRATRPAPAHVPEKWRPVFDKDMRHLKSGLRYDVFTPEIGDKLRAPPGSGWSDAANAVNTVVKQRFAKQNFGQMEIVSLGAVRPALALVSIAAALAGAAPAQAQGRLDARYVVTLAGLPIGKGAWVIDIAEDQYTAAASGATSGLLRVFASGQGSGASRGFMVNGTPVAASFAASITADKKTEEIRMTLGSGDVKDVAITPPTQPNPERVPVTDAHRRSTNDPMTGSLIRVPGNGTPLSPQACSRNIAIFDGRLRYDLQLSYKRMEQVKADKGYEGPAVVCAVQFSPVAGYVPSRAAIKYLKEQRDMEVWLAPVAATRVLVPFRVSIPTPIGVGVMQATQFVSVAQPPRAAAAGARTQ